MGCCQLAKAWDLIILCTLRRCRVRLDEKVNAALHIVHLNFEGNISVSVEVFLTTAPAIQFVSEIHITNIHILYVCYWRCKIFFNLNHHRCLS